MKHILWGILLVVLVGCGETSPGSSTSHFKTLRVEQQDLTQDRQFTARIESQQNIDVRPLITGIVQKICVKEGARVKKGEPLLIRLPTLPPSMLPRLRSPQPAPHSPRHS